MDRLKWDRRMLEVANLVATWSKDPSTKVGAVIARPNYTICSTGYNGFPRGIDDYPDLYADRDEKVDRILHAEMNALLVAPEPVTGYTLFTTFFPCKHCALSVIQAGISRVVAVKQPPSLNERWSTATSERLFNEAGVETMLYD